MKKIIVIYVILFFSNCMTMKRQPPIISITKLPVNCAGLHNFLSDNWYKHRKKKCHKVFDAYKFLHDYKECITKLTKIQVKGLFGEPDIVTEYGEFRYILDSDCSDNSLRHYDYISIDFNQDLVRNIEIGGMSSVD
jgi:hypothetical protein